MRLSLRDPRVQVVFFLPEARLLSEEIVTLRLFPHVIKRHTLPHRAGPHLAAQKGRNWASSKHLWGKKNEEFGVKRVKFQVKAAWKSRNSWFRILELR